MSCNFVISERKVIIVAIIVEPFAKYINMKIYLVRLRTWQVKIWWQDAEFSHISSAFSLKVSTGYVGLKIQDRHYWHNSLLDRCWSTAILNSFWIRSDANLATSRPPPAILQIIVLVAPTTTMMKVGLQKVLMCVGEIARRQCEPIFECSLVNKLIRIFGYLWVSQGQTGSFLDHLSTITKNPSGVADYVYTGVLYTKLLNWFTRSIGF